MEKKVALFLVDGFEEIEAIAPLDIMRRAGITVDTISINENKIVTSPRNLKIFVDKSISEIDIDSYDLILLPGGPGVKNYFNSDELLESIVKFSKNKKIAAICAAPTIFASLGLLENKNAICYPSCEKELIEKGAKIIYENVVKDENIITSRGAGTAIDFGLEIVKVLLNEEKYNEIKKSIIYNMN